MMNDDRILMDDKNAEGKLWITKKIIKKIIFNALYAENYQINDVIISNNQNNLAALIKITLPLNSDLSQVKSKVMDLIQKRISHVININTMAINLVLKANGNNNANT